LFDALSGGTVKTLGMSCDPFRADIGNMVSAGVIESLAVKNVDVKVTLKGAVYMSLMRLPKSNIISFCSANNDR
jgi:hypothetical protein